MLMLLILGLMLLMYMLMLLMYTLMLLMFILLIIDNVDLVILLYNLQRPIMEIEGYQQICRNGREVENRIIKYKRLLEANRAQQYHLQQIKLGLKQRLWQLDRKIVENKVKTSTHFECKLAQQKTYFQSIFDQELIRNPTSPHSRVFSNIITLQKHQPNPLPSCRTHVVNLSLKEQKSPLEMLKQLRIKQQLQIPFNENEYKLLIKCVKKYGRNWDKVGGFFPNHSHKDIEKYYHMYRKDHQIEGGRWTLRQNLILLVLVEHIHEPKWAEMAKKLTQKTDVMIRQRYCNILKPQLSKTQWTKFQEAELMRLAKEYNFCWSKLVSEVSLFSNKTDNSLRRKYRSLIIDWPEEDIYTVIGAKNKNLAMAIIANKHDRSRSRQRKFIRIKNTLNQ